MIVQNPGVKVQTPTDLHSLSLVESQSVQYAEIAAAAAAGGQLGLSRA